VASGEGGNDASLRKHARCGDRYGEDCRLRVFGQFKLVFGAFEDELRDWEAESGICLFKDQAGNGVIVEEVATHANGLRTLAGKEES
jgi:hypothetical protein